MRILLVKPQTELRHMLAFLLESELGFQIHEAISAAEAIEMLKADPGRVDFVLCDDHVENRPLLEFLGTIDYGSRCILMRPRNVAAAITAPGLLAGTVNPLALVPELKALTGSVNVPPRPAADEEDDPAYCKVSAEMVTRVLPLEADVYLRLSGKKYVKVFKQGHTVRAKDIQDFLAQKKIPYLYVRKEDSTQLISRMRAEVARLLAAPRMNPAAAAVIAGEIHQSIYDLGRQIGFTPEVQELAKQGVQMAVRSIGRHPILAKVLKAMIADSKKYVTTHSVLVSQVACAIASILKWPSGTTFQKLTFAGFFHDIILRNQELAQIEDLAELEARSGEFKPAEIQAYRQHPLEVARLISSFNEVPADVDIILTQHHERPDGSGFPRGLGSLQIAPLACVFIIAHDLVAYTTRHGEQGLEGFLTAYRARYSHGHFRRILEELTENGAFLTRKDT